MEAEHLVIDGDVLGPGEKGRPARPVDPAVGVSPHFGQGTSEIQGAADRYRQASCAKCRHEVDHVSVKRPLNHGLHLVRPRVLR